MPSWKFTCRKPNTSRGTFPIPSRNPSLQETIKHQGKTAGFLKRMGNQPLEYLTIGPIKRYAMLKVVETQALSPQERCPDLTQRMAAAKHEASVGTTPTTNHWGGVYGFPLLRKPWWFGLMAWGFEPWFLQRVNGKPPLATNHRHLCVLVWYSLLLSRRHKKPNKLYEVFQKRASFYSAFSESCSKSHKVLNHKETSGDRFLAGHGTSARCLSSSLTFADTISRTVQLHSAVTLHIWVTRYMLGCSNRFVRGLYRCLSDATQTMSFGASDPFCRVPDITLHSKLPLDIQPA